MRGSSHAICHYVGLRTQHAKRRRRAACKRLHSRRREKRPRQSGASSRSSEEPTRLPAALRIAPLIGRPVRRAVLSGARIVLGGGLHFLAALTCRGRLLGALVALTGACLLLGRPLLRPALAAGRRLVLLALLTGAHVLIGRRLRAGAALAARRRLGGTLVALPARARHSESGHGAVVDLSGGLETLLALERDQRLPGAHTKPAVGLANVEPLLDQYHLHPPDLIRREIDRTGAAADIRAAAIQSRPASTGSDRHDGNDLAAIVDDHDIVAHDEVLVSAILREELDQNRIDVDDAHAGRHRGADRQ